MRLTKQTSMSIDSLRKKIEEESYMADKPVSLDNELGILPVS